MSWGGLGPTHWNWTPEVAALVAQVERKFPGVQCNTYVGHPFRGWDRFSIDCWGPGGRGDPIPYRQGLAVRKYLMTRPGAPFIRHTIYINRIWLSWSGYQVWTPSDHKGWLRHLHVTYWPHESGNLA